MLYTFSRADLIPYILLYTVLLILATCRYSERSKARFMFGVLFVFSAIRYGIGFDFFTYKFAVEDLSLAGGEMERWELIPRLIGYLARVTDFQVFIVLMSFFSLYAVYWASVRLSVSPSLSLLVFSLHPMMFLDGLSIMRNAVAFALIPVAFYYLRQKQIKISLLIWVIACFFHKAALIGVLIYPFYYFRVSRMLNLIFFLVSFVVSSLLPAIISFLAQHIPLFQLVDYYINNMAAGGGGKLQYINDAIALFHLAFWDRLEAASKDNCYYLTFYNIGICLWNLFLPLDSTIAMRLGMFFMYFLIFLVPSYQMVLTERYAKLTKELTILFFVAFVAASFYIVSSAPAGDHLSYLPYQTFFYHTDFVNYLYR